ncbi:MAG: 4-alpha-glucanotransferase [Ferruginibacter sp.]|nr:4-alpha-glucanotransferase [Ferruginibacter sp.]
MILNFYIRFSTEFGESLFVSGNHDALGNDDFTKAIPLQYFNEEFWQGRVEVPMTEFNSHDIQYRYILVEKDATQIVEWGDDRILDGNKITANQLVLIDTWNHAGLIENAFYTKPFQEVLLKTKLSSVKQKSPQNFTHEFRVKAPLLKDGEVLCIGGSGVQLGEWASTNPSTLSKDGNWWTIKVNLASEIFPIAYKYGVYNVDEKMFLGFEKGRNRTLNSSGIKSAHTIIHDGFAQLESPNWKGAGVAIPVFSLRSEGGFGTGEFTDIKLLVDWAKITGLKLIQLLPINDTTATHNFVDSYPYAAISTFALHPLYLNLDKVAGSKNAAVLKPLKKKQAELNNLPDIDYEAVMNVKFSVAGELYNLQKKEVLNNTRYFEFFDLNRHWLVPYAVFCYLRDKYKTADYTQWKLQSRFDESAIQALASPTEKHYDSIAIHYFIQYHLYLQLKEVTAYAHGNGIVVKGDLPIGIYRYGCDAWMSPELYNMDAQAGAPPDDFAVKGQNWGFPTYNWKKMQEDGFSWWRKRFEQMSEYFDAFRIDHILGFFRIWSIPLHAVEGIMGKFVPVIPIHLNELHQLGISFQADRYCKPYITDEIVNERFGAEASYVKNHFLLWNEGSFQLNADFDTQRKVEHYFAQLPETDKHLLIKAGLFDVISNVIFFEEEGSGLQQFHFRINMDQTTSFRDLDEITQQELKQLYINYFFRRQDDFWKKEAMNKLPGLKRSTNMLVCGEDLGMVPDCVPEVMRQLGLLSLEIQRMPKDPHKEFFHPADAPYLSVVTPSTHDMSTIRGWWEEDPAKTQRFYNLILGHQGASPFYCEAAINKEILVQHLNSPAMWSIFQLQDIMGIDEVLRRENPNDERINIPANPKHYWRYRMHVPLEELVNKTEFNKELRSYIKAGGR